MWNKETSEYDLYEPILLFNSANRWVRSQGPGQLYPNDQSESDLLNLSKTIDEQTWDVTSEDGTKLVGDRVEGFDLANSTVHRASDAVLKATKANRFADEQVNDLKHQLDELGVDEDGKVLKTRQTTKEATQEEINSILLSLSSAKASAATSSADLAIANWKLAKANELLNDAQKKAYGTPVVFPDQISSETAQLMRNRIDLLKTQLFGGSYRVPLPTASLRIGSTPVATGVFPTSVQAGNKVTVAVIGTDLADVDLNRIGLAAGNVDAEDASADPPFNAQLVNGSLLLTFSPTQTVLRTPSVPNQDNIDQAETGLDLLIQQSRLPGAIVTNQMTAIGDELANLKKKDSTFLGTLDGSPITVEIALYNKTFDQQALSEAWNTVQSTKWRDEYGNELKYYVTRLLDAGGLSSAEQEVVGLPDLKIAWANFAKQFPKEGQQISAKDFNDAIAAVGTKLTNEQNAKIKLSEAAIDNVLGPIPTPVSTPTTAPATTTAAATTPVPATTPAPSSTQPSDPKQFDKLKGLLKDLKQDLEPIKKAGDLNSGDLKLAEAPIDTAFANQQAATASSSGVVALAEKNLDSAQRRLDDLKLIVTADQAKAAMAGGAKADPRAAEDQRMLAAAQAAVDTAKTRLEQMKLAPEQAIQFSLPSATDSTAVVYTPAIAVRAGDPSDLTVAPQTIQLGAASTAAGAGSATASSGPTSTAGGGNSASGSTATAGATPQALTAIIAGNNLAQVDTAHITMVPPSPTPITARMVGTSILIDMSVSSPGTIYFQLPLVAGGRQVVTPPITVKAAATSNSTSAPVPLVTAIYPSSVKLTGGTGPVDVYIIGANLDQIDAGSLTIEQGIAKILPGQNNATSPTSSGSLKVSLDVSAFPTPPIVIGLPIKGAKGQSVNSFPLTVEKQ